ncbi:uncharacterized protein LOC135374165 [Ornithodoros turicata]|uniref:uncharacterized protein LOC135374165 n=1 Tax=Ornithodoros turicata TaxID=34597 RepID=UPI003138EFAE
MIAVKCFLAVFACMHLSVPIEGCKMACYEEQCPLKNRIKYHGDLVSCSYKCTPSNECSCYGVEEKGASCLRMDHAKEGKCFQGKCYSDDNEYERVTAGKQLNKNMLCGFGHDYLYNSRGAFGCTGYCGQSPYQQTKRPDGYRCLGTSSSKLAEHLRQFSAVTGFPHDVGTLNGCHIQLSPPKDHAADNFNYKGRYSTILLGLVEHSYKFQYGNDGSPGRNEVITE